MDICRYDYLVVAPGLQTNWSAIPGLAEGLADPTGPVSSIYSGEGAEKTFRNVKNFKEGAAVRYITAFEGSD